MIKGSGPHWARVDAAKEPERWKRWMEDFGQDAVPILSPEPQYGELNGEQVQLVRMDLGPFDQEARARIAHGIARQYGVSAEGVLADLNGAHGLPLIYEGLTILQGEPNLPAHRGMLA